jgi:uncharacterized protein (TIGR01777 family)
VGGTGLIGSALADTLRRRGDEVVIISRSKLDLPGAVKWDPVKGVQRVSSLEGLDGLFNLAGAPLATRPWTLRRRALLRASRIDATEVLLESLAELDAPPAVYVGVGLLGLFGDSGEKPLDEEAPRGTGFLADLAAEWEAAHLAAADLGVRASVLRLSIVLSPTGGVFPLMVPPFRIMGGWLGNGQQWTSWLTIRDCVGALIHLADNPECEGPFNGTVPEPLRNKAWLRALGTVLHRPVATHAPKWALRGALGDLADELLIASLRAIPQKLVNTGYNFVDGDAEEAFRWMVAEIDRRERVPPTEG